MKKIYVLGNVLRGYVTGEFHSKKRAWSVLSNRFLISFPTDNGGGRYVNMYVRTRNSYGHEQFIKCVHSEITEINNLKRETVMTLAKPYTGICLNP